MTGANSFSTFLISPSVIFWLSSSGLFSPSDSADWYCESDSDYVSELLLVSIFSESSGAEIIKFNFSLFLVQFLLQRFDVNFISKSFHFISGQCFCNHGKPNIMSACTTGIGYKSICSQCLSFIDISISNIVSSIDDFVRGSPLTVSTVIGFFIL
ncbi:hypothetical protein AYI69_g3195 [Smittium culicis]|uniref:Uncharacterized protein n=1 Tax=Smittium culicis TaxID=133412 RepID=A0A1R1YKB6_9FUNG|nr:hypothetical protein AYI69_g3195 [Smittium culicis]